MTVVDPIVGLALVAILVIWSRVVPAWLSALLEGSSFHWSLFLLRFRVHWNAVGYSLSM